MASCFWFLGARLTHPAEAQPPKHTHTNPSRGPTEEPVPSHSASRGRPGAPSGHPARATQAVGVFRQQRHWVLREGQAGREAEGDTGDSGHTAGESKAAQTTGVGAASGGRHTSAL